LAFADDLKGYVKQNDERLEDMKKFGKPTGPVNDDVIAKMMYKIVTQITNRALEEDAEEAKELVSNLLRIFLIDPGKLCYS